MSSFDEGKFKFRVSALALHQTAIYETKKVHKFMIRQYGHPSHISGCSSRVGGETILLPRLLESHEHCIRNERVYRPRLLLVSID
jgi:hypothetical protein